MELCTSYPRGVELVDLRRLPPGLLHCHLLAPSCVWGLGLGLSLSVVVRGLLGGGIWLIENYVDVILNEPNPTLSSPYPL